MSLLQSIFLGILQGITEFLPISSSGHLIILESIFKLNVETLKTYDVALHIGSLAAILIYFRKTILHIITKDRKYIVYLIIGTIPAVIAGFLLEDFIDKIFRGTLTVGIAMIVVGIYFLLAERRKLKAPSSNQAISSNLQALFIGLAQMFALIPGVSRSGSTIATGILLGLDRKRAAEFSFLLGSIAITGAGLLTALDATDPLDLRTTGMGFAASLISSYFAIRFLMKFFEKNTLRPFAYYRFAVGILAIALTLA
ncbi:MAG: undecaprenyl-diphosphate phosphatase [Candidatus Gracilibacteria bacterium]|jgi:undecaprenyl-diphosphatase